MKTKRLSFQISLSLLLIAFASGCARDLSKVRVLAPPVIEYSPQFQRKAMLELQALPEDSSLRTFLRDYLRLRDQLREASIHEFPAPSGWAPSLLPESAKLPIE